MWIDRLQRRPLAGLGARGLHALRSTAAVACRRTTGLRAGLARRLREAALRLAARRTRFAAAAAAVAALALVWTVIVVRDLRTQIDAEVGTAQHHLDNVTEVGVHAMELAVRGADMLLIDLRDEWANHRWHFPGLVQMRERHPAIGFEFDITVLDRDGRVVYSTAPADAPGMDWSHLPLMARLRDASGDLLSISAVRWTGQRVVMDLARRLTTGDGTFDGVVICSVPSDYLRAQFADVTLESRTTLTAVRNDGRVLVQLTSGPGRTLSVSSPAAQWAPVDGTQVEGRVLRVRGSGGEQRLVAWRQAHAYPFRFAVTSPTDGLDAAVGRLRLRYGLIATVLSAAVLVGLWRLARHEELRERVTREQGEHLRAMTQAQDALEASERTLRKLSSHHLAVKEAEHRRIAQEIHDELGQRLTVHRLDLAMLPGAVREQPERDLALRVAAMKDDVDAMLRIARDVARQLRPGALEIGLAPAVESMLRDVQDRLGVRCEFDNRLPADFTTDDTRATTAFRIAQEAVTNAVRHANPRCIRVMLDCSQGRLRIEVQDDGSGFDEQAPGPGYGLSGMRERARALGGSLSIRSMPGQGTTVAADIPLQGEIEDATRIPAPAAATRG
jgi:signal transduction histidine kinase